MAMIIVATYPGCRVFTEAGEGEIELRGRSVSALTREAGGTCLAAVDGQEVWRRALSGAWSKIADAGIALQSITSTGGEVFCGGMDQAAIVRISNSGEPERLKSFDSTPGRSEWFAGGPPLGVRSLSATADGSAILAAVHVGGIPRSEDGGESWVPTLPIMYDVHEVCAHASVSSFVAAASAVGLCTSHDGGKSWAVHAEGLEIANSLAVAVLDEEVLFGIADGPFAKQSQVWRWRIGGGRLEQVRDGLPEWLAGKVDTAHIAARRGQAATHDGAGTIWLSTTGSKGWKAIATGVAYPSGMLIL